MMVILKSLKISHPKKSAENVGNVINSNNGNNYGSVGGDFKPTLNLVCGSKYSDETLIVDFAFWTEDRKNIPDMLDAINTADIEFLAQQVVDGKVYHADRETKIAVTDEYDGGETVEIKFLEGRYKNKVGYTLAEFVRDVGRAREQAKIAQEKKEKEEQARLEREQAAFEEAKAKEKARL